MNMYALLVPAGSDTQVQYNNGSLFGGDSALTWDDGAAKALTIGNCAVLGSDSAVFQPNADSTTFFQVKNAAGAIVGNFDTSNIRFGVGIDAPISNTDIRAAANGTLTIGSTNTSFGVLAPFGTIDFYNSDWSTPGPGVASRIQAVTTTAGGVGGHLTFSVLGTDTSDVLTEIFSVRARNDVSPTSLGALVAPDSFRMSRSTGGLNAEGVKMLWGSAYGPYITSIGGDADEDVQGLVFYVHPSSTFTDSPEEALRIHTSGGTWAIGINEPAPETLIELTHATPYMTLHNSTHEDTDGGRESRINFKGEQSGEEETTLVRIEARHDGAADDQKGEVVISTNDGADADTPTDAVFIDSSQQVGIGNAPTIPFDMKAKIGMTSIGGLAIKLTNTTGAVTVQGQTVKADPTTDDAVILTAADDDECIGVFLDAGVADDAEAWVVVAGIADVAMGDNEATTAGNWVETNSTEAGYADATAATPAAAPQHFNEIGHCIETVAAGGGGTHILARCVLHFN